ncbi:MULTISPECIES: 30S ribosomal protein S17e [Methanosphaerula]|jgi:small subunit ribosomal protein S17e|uniref:Small ribosomal subunit protein eS17 n=1 Tax=Methanosphaerula palustris (strain ATCC BAA-1556 / DSM 19958 / E1-9c) TaxID=521011 RepID=RS17E_METPE|nr:30S ribosomal protein S17e [Methanosphaerula palustris]B8GKG8.1 RecName: Full=Small ribosomal subunit protein eS17; AltName: Full=30S ribosomal protein S17e [Methanosphaerula palustris E1-9c]ACL15851.1 30S ribosomal protein S17e [Methanosphaerula palustris E1-9c]
MGIKPSYIKNFGLELIGRYGDRFTPDFDENKHQVSELTVIDSKRVRNRIAGFITRKVNTKKHL